MDQKGKTKSSWIFLEMVTSKIIRKKSRELSLESIDMMESGRSLKYLPIEYPLDLSHLLRIDADDLKKWQTKFQAKNNKIDEDNRLLSLDILYQMHNSNLR